MKQFFWRDLEDLQGQWGGLSIEISGPPQGKPQLHLRTGNNARLKLMFNETPLLWGTMATSYYGAWLVRNPLPMQWASPLVPAIDSAQVEHHRHLPAGERMKAWSRYFINQLMEHQADFLYPGHWVARPMMPVAVRSQRGEGVSNWYFSTEQEMTSHLPRWSACGDGILDNLQPRPVEWLDWDLGNLIGLHTVDSYAGRMKWWRKKAREDSLPPVLLWYVGALCSYVIIDGHYRLQAALAENVKPTFIVLSSTKTYPLTPNPDTQQRVFNSLMLQSERNPGFDVRTLNQALINNFDDRPCHSAKTHAWAGIVSDTEWSQEVKQFLLEREATEELDDILERCQPSEW